MQLRMSQNYDMVIIIIILMYYQFNFINMIIITQLLYMVTYLYHKHVMFIHISLLLIPRIMIYDNSAKPQWLLVKTIYMYILLLPCSSIMHMYIHLYICMCMYACIYVCTYLSHAKTPSV